MKITWYGHAAFLIESGDLRIIMDPYTSTCGFDPINDHADIITISHHNEKYHSGTSEINGNFELIDGMLINEQPKQSHGIEFKSQIVFEDDEGTGPNAMLHFELEDLKIAHLGDLGHQLNDAQLESLSGTDILLALAGGYPTISMDDLALLIDRLKPSVVIPMHFKCGKLDLPIHDESLLLSHYDNKLIDRVSGSSVEITQETLSNHLSIIVLEPLR